MDNHRMEAAACSVCLLMLILTGCSPQAVASSETQIAGTGIAVANGMLTSTLFAVTPRVNTPVPTPLPFDFTPPVNSTGTGSAGIPVTGATSPAAPFPSANGPQFTATASAGLPPATGSRGPVPTATPLPAVPVTGATSIASTGAAGCNHPLDVAAAGPKVSLMIKNNTFSPISFTMGLAGVNSFGQCGFLSWPRIPPRSNIDVVVPQTRTAFGDTCYWAYAVINGPKGQFLVSDGGFCLGNARNWIFNVNTDRLRLLNP